jgi:glucokinase
MTELILGVDIGGTNSKLGLVTKEGTLLIDTVIDTRSDETVEVFIRYFTKAYHGLLEGLGGAYKVIAAGVGAPNGNYHSGCIEGAPNIHWGDIIPITRLISQAIKLPVWLTNDANAAAVGELKFGTAKGLKDFVVFTLGTGFGSGIFSNGKLIYGHDGFAGEIGHTTSIINGRSHTTGRFGSLETYVSATGIVRTTLELLGDRHEDSKLRAYKEEEITSKRIADHAELGDPIALMAFDRTGDLLARQIGETCSLLNPEAIILFGGVVKAGKLLTDPMNKHLEKYLPQGYHVDVRISNMKGGNMAILGSAALAIEEYRLQAAI